MLKTRKLKLWAVVLPTILVLTACSDGTNDPVSTKATDPVSTEATDQESTAKLAIVVTTTILGDLVKAIVGDAGTVEVLLPVGADPHDFQPSSLDGVKVREADLVVANGLGLEESLISMFASAREDGARILEVGDYVSPLAWGEGGREEHHDEEGAEEEEGEHHDEEGEEEEEGEHHDEEGEEEDHGDEDDHGEEGDHGHEGGFDPHFWFDPSRVETAIQVITAELIALGRGGSAQEWNERAETYIAEIREATEEAQRLLSAVPSSMRKLVTNHDSFSYFGDFFGFAILDTILSGGSTLAQPGTAHLASLVEAIANEDVPAIFTETTSDSSVALTVAAEFDPPLQVVELYTGSLGPSGSDADTYPKWLVSNARLIAEALSP